jgi:hypothetical protein
MSANLLSQYGCVLSADLPDTGENDGCEGPPRWKFGTRLFGLSLANSQSRMIMSSR